MSHALHIYLMHAPDHLGYDGAVSLARDHALSTAEWVSGFDFPEFSHDHELLALVDADRYPIERGIPHTSRGLTFPVAAFDTHIAEDPTSSRVTLTGRGPYLTGPAAWYGLNAERLAPLATEVADAAGPPKTYLNPFRAIMIRAVEIVHAIEEALRLIEAYEPPSIQARPREGTGCWATEAPRGVLFHRYSLAADGTITSARILQPTSQNQASIEDGLRRFVQDRLDLDDHQLAHECEQAIRNYDPCISCAPHALALTVVRS